MLDLPPQHFECMYSQISQETNLNAMMSAPSFSEAQILTFAELVLQEFSHGVTWSDIPSLVVNTVTLFQKTFGSIDFEQVMASVISKAVDLSNSFHLSNPFANSIFKRLSHALLAFVCAEASQDPALAALPKEDLNLANLSQLASALIDDIAPGMPPTSDQLRQYAVDLQTVFNDGFQAADVVHLVLECHQFVSSVSDLSSQDQRACIIEIIDDFIDITDIPYVPDFLVDPLFKLAVPSLVDFVLDREAKMTAMG